MSKSLKTIIRDFEKFSDTFDDEMIDCKLEYAFPSCILRWGEKSCELDTNVYELIKDCSSLSREIASRLRWIGDELNRENVEFLSDVSKSIRAITKIVEGTPESISNLVDDNIEIAVSTKDIVELSTVWSKLKFCQRFLEDEFRK